MSFRNTLENCQKRIPWGAMSLLLKMHNIPVGRGWEKTTEKLLALRKDDPAMRKKLNVLDEIYYDYLQAGDRAIRLFKVPEANIAKLLNILDNYQPEETAFHKTFPYPLADQELSQVDSSTSLVAVIKGDGHVNLVFCTKRFVTERKELTVDELGEQAREFLSSYDEVIAVKHHMKQAFDVVSLRPDGYIELRIDTSGGITSDDITIAIRSLNNAFRMLSSSLIGDELIGFIPLNLFPLVNAMYQSPEGRVCELAFTTDTASIKHEKMRKKEICLRSEAYHRAGKSAVHHITPYRLGVCWTHNIIEDIDSKPELLIPGSFRLLGQEHQFIGEAIISNCCRLEDFQFVVNKMKAYLPT